MEAYDQFISHASEDKDTLARPLANALTGLAQRVWYDEYTLIPGDSLSASIDKGLRDSRHGILILSPDFLQKYWTDYEFRSLVALEARWGKKIIPVWHGVTPDDVLEYSPHLADKFAIVATGKDPRRVALEILRAVSPEQYTTLIRALIARRHMQDSVILTPIDELAPAPLREPLSQDHLRRLRLIHESLIDIFPVTWERTVENFQRDAPEYRERELAQWEKISWLCVSFRRRYSLSDVDAKNLFGFLMGASIGVIKSADNSTPPWMIEALQIFSEPISDTE